MCVNMIYVKNWKNNKISCVQCYDNVQVQMRAIDTVKTIEKLWVDVGMALDTPGGKPNAGVVCGTSDVDVRISPLEFVMMSVTRVGMPCTVGNADTFT